MLRALFHYAYYHQDTDPETVYCFGYISTSSKRDLQVSLNHIGPRPAAGYRIVRTGPIWHLHALSPEHFERLRSEVASDYCLRSEWSEAVALFVAQLYRVGIEQLAKRDLPTAAALLLSVSVFPRRGVAQYYLQPTFSDNNTFSVPLDELIPCSSPAANN